MPTPGFTLTATLQDLSGTPFPGKLKVTLCSPTLGEPCIPGTATLDQIELTLTADSLGKISKTFWGNDVISPTGTFYCIQGLDTAENVIWAQNYQFTGNVTKDLSVLIPYDPNAPVVAGPQNSVVFGAIDGVNMIYTLATVPAFALLFRNGQYQTPGIDYSRSGLTITYLTTPLQPGVGGAPGDSHVAVTFAATSSNIPTAGVVSGTINGINTIFTLSSAPAALMLYKNGALMTPGGVDYTLAGATITYVNPPMPPVGGAPGDSHTGVLFAAAPTGVPADTVVSGTINGINETFNVPAVPVFLMLYFDGAFQTPGVDYTLAGAIITYLNYAPVPGDTHHALTFASV